MEILYITPSLPNDFSRIRTKNILTAFKRLNYKITLISLYYKESELENLDNVRKLVDNVILFKQPKIKSIMYCLIGILLPCPLRVSYVKNKKLKKYLSLNEKKYDLVYIKRLRMAQYAKKINNRNIYIDITDSLTKYYERISKKSKGISKILALEEYFKHKIYEISIAKNYNTIICSEEEKKYLEEKFNIKLDNMYVINNSIDTKVWINNNLNVNLTSKRTKLVFSGMLDYEPNIIAIHYIADNILPALDEKYDVYIIGKNCSDELKKLENARMHFVGFVPDMKEELLKYDIYLCPILAGSGVKNKILQASSVGLPIVSTPLGVEGIDEELKKNIFVSNDTKKIIENINKINKMNSEKLMKLLKKQQDLIIKKYDVEVGIKKLVTK